MIIENKMAGVMETTSKQLPRHNIAKLNRQRTHIFLPAIRVEQRTKIHNARLHLIQAAGT